MAAHAGGYSAEEMPEQSNECMTIRDHIYTHVLLRFVNAQTLTKDFLYKPFSFELFFNIKCFRNTKSAY
jgi:hypothetical protein